MNDDEYFKIKEILEDFKWHLSDAVRDDFARFADEMENELAFLHDEIKKLELRVEVLEDDKVKQTIAFYAALLGISEEEFLKRVVEYIKKKGIIE